MTTIALIMKLLGVPESQVYSISYEKMQLNLSQIMKTKENKGKLILQVLSIDESGKLDVGVRQV